MKYIFSILVLFSNICLYANSDYLNISVSPPIIKMKLYPNSVKNAKIVISNNNDKAIELLPVVMDLELDIHGNPLAVPLSKNNKWSCSDWLKFKDGPIIIPPFESVDFSFQLQVPGNSQWGHYSIIMFQSKNINDDTKEIELIGRLGTILMLEIAGKKFIDAIIKQFNIQQFKEEIDFKIIVQNISNVDIQCRGSIVIIDNNNRIIDRLKLNGGTGTILPEGEREFLTTWNFKKFAPGFYTAKLQLLIPGASKVYQKELQITI